MCSETLRLGFTPSSYHILHQRNVQKFLLIIVVSNVTDYPGMSLFDGDDEI